MHSPLPAPAPQAPRGHLAAQCQAPASTMPSLAMALAPTTAVKGALWSRAAGAKRLEDLQEGAVEDAFGRGKKNRGKS